MDSHHSKPPADAPAGHKSGSGWVRLWQVLGLVLACYVIEQDVQAVLWDLRALPNAGTIGAEIAQLQPARDFPPGFRRLTRVDAGSPLALAGAAGGDHLRFDRAYDYLRYLTANEPVGFTLDHQGRRTHQEVVSVPRRSAPGDWLAIADAIAYDLANLLPALFGAFILWRCHARPISLILGTALLCFGIVRPWPQMLEGQPATFAVFFILNIFVNVFLNNLLFWLFSMKFFEDRVAKISKYQWNIFNVYAAILALVTIAYSALRYSSTILPVFGDGSNVLKILIILSSAASLYYMFIGWRRSTLVVRRRYALLLAAFSAICIAHAIYYGVRDLGTLGSGGDLSWLFADFLSGVVAPVLFTYAILRHRVLHLGFAINRTLVYTIVSAVLLATFGVTEWAVNQLLPIHGRENNALVDAVVAVGIFLMFHRVRDSVEHGVEAIFFRRWQEAEAALRRFVHDAAFITRRETLAKAFTAALNRFGDGAGAALYLRRPAGDYALDDGGFAGAPPVVDPDDPALVTLRAHHKTVELDGSGSPLPAALALPMVYRHEILGFVLLGHKPSGHGYRPDEIEVLGWASHLVGLDLHALTVEQLEETAAQQDREIATLRSLITRPA